MVEYSPTLIKHTSMLNQYEFSGVVKGRALAAILSKVRGFLEDFSPGILLCYLSWVLTKGFPTQITFTRVFLVWILSGMNDYGELPHNASLHMISLQYVFSCSFTVWMINHVFLQCEFSHVYESIMTIGFFEIIII